MLWNSILLGFWGIGGYTILPSPISGIGFVGIGILFLILVDSDPAWRIDSPGWGIHGVSAAIPLILFWILYHRVLDYWWMHDDFCHLAYIVREGIVSAFYHPEKNFSFVNLTPWEPFSLGIDFHLFGLAPKGFYFHQLVGFSLIIGMAYFGFKPFFPPAVIAFTLSWFVVTTPAIQVASFLMVRQYLEGMIFSLISAALFMRSLRRDRIGWAIGGGFFYLLACSAKEVYVPVVLMLYWIPCGKEKSKLKMMTPYFGVAVFYVLWRMYMLRPENIVTGYSRLEWYMPIDFKAILLFPREALRLLEWDKFGHGYILFALFVAFLFSFWNWSVKEKLGAGVWAFCVLGPILPVSTVLSKRYFFVFVLVFAIVLGVGFQYVAERSRRRKAVAAMAFVLILTGCALVQDNMKDIEAYGGIRKTEGLFLLYGQADDAVLLTHHPHCLEELLWLRKEKLNRPSGPVFCETDEPCACVIQYPSRDLWRLSDGKVRPIHQKTTDVFQDCNTTTGRLSVDMTYSDGFISWNIGPYAEGEYYYIGNVGNKSRTKFEPIGKAGQARIHIEDIGNAYVVIKYRSPEGKIIYSPVLNFSASGDATRGGIQWSRSADR